MYIIYIDGITSPLKQALADHAARHSDPATGKRMEVEPGADMSDADLRGADLRDANLSGADLTDADLSGADLTGTDLTGSTYNVKTKFPAGLDPEAAGMII